MQVGICSFSVNKSNIFIFAKPTRTVVIRSSSRADGGHTHRPHTLYGLLGIKRSATLAEIRAAYRNAARQLHPDTNASPAAQEDFQRIKAAYEILGDSSLRKLYDNVGLQALGPKFATLWSYLGNGSDDAGAPGDEQRGVRAGPGGGGVRGRDVHLVLGIMLSEAAQGTEKVLSYAAMATCEDCQGSGYSSAPPACTVCRGSGQILKSQYLGAADSGQFAGPKVLGLDTCPACAGSGRVDQPPCTSCLGRGRRSSSRDLAVRIPAGVERGQVLRVCGEGGAGRCGGPPGDLLVRLEVYPDPNLERRGHDLHSSLVLDVFVAVLGGAVEVETVRGARMLQVPPGSQPGDVLRLRGAGIIRAAPGGAGTVRGDHYFTLAVRLPSAHELCGASRELLRQLAVVDSTLRLRRNSAISDECGAAAAAAATAAAGSTGG
ncbi:hypothetical protein Vretimale_1681 [Volvox reticuliferus]|uniref:Molecular chaperone n=1 Tax=Volvox reticuliferus TaxID=1737510 RepID=A0A8J4D616_9CHLO|nr:hypothetical protein Vretifemale_15522 [Volvox reticuliferus]GIL95716.1 hypothetical protein Vretimale_1681 [Volvox reticuliferus]